MTTLDKINKTIENNQKTNSRSHLGASEIGADCPRQIWYKFRRVKTERHPARLLRLFERGHLEEKRFIKWLRDAGVVAVDVDHDGEQFGFEMFGGHFAGSCDGSGYRFVEDPKLHALLEFKTSAQKYYNQLVKHGVKKAVWKHYVQMQIYMHEFELKKAYYMSINKNTDDIHAEWVDYDREIAEKYIDRAEFIIFTDEPPLRECKTRSYYKGKMCGYHSHCWDTVMPEKGCRTCAFSTPERDGSWSCARDNCVDNDLWLPNPYIINNCSHEATKTCDGYKLKFKFDNGSIVVFDSKNK